MLRIAVVGNKDEITRYTPSREVRKPSFNKTVFAVFDIEGIDKDEAPDMSGPVFVGNGFYKKCYNKLRSRYPGARKIIELDLKMYHKGIVKVKKVWFSKNSWKKGK